MSPVPSTRVNHVDAAVAVTRVDVGRKPFLKWAGGKFRLRHRILAALPPGARLVEPFAGSAAIYLNADYQAALICDINRDVVDLYKAIQAEGEAFIQYCRSFFQPENNVRERFYQLRERFNALHEPWERSALLLYLNRHAYNGLVRYNAKGAFNAPFGKYARPYFPLAELRQFYAKTLLTKTEFFCADFRQVFDLLRCGDVVYCDPPYIPLSDTASFTSYAGNVFGLTEQQDLAEAARKARARGIAVIVSNHDTPVVHALYAKARLERFEVRRTISCLGAKRNTAPELLAIFD